MSVLILFGCHAGNILEKFEEILLIVYADLLRYVLDLYRWICEDLLRPADAKMIDVIQQ